MTTNLTEFLLARIAEDEQAARVAEGDSGADRWVCWETAYDGMYVDAQPLDNHRPCYAEETGTTKHIARHDPARVLAECEAKRHLVGLATDRLFDRTYTSEILGILALPYADHPDYQPEWRP